MQWTILRPSPLAPRHVVNKGKFVHDLVWFVIPLHHKDRQKLQGDGFNDFKMHSDFKLIQ